MIIPTACLGANRDWPRGKLSAGALFDRFLVHFYSGVDKLFLGVDLQQGSDLLATYSEVVQEIPSLLTTCFSKSPVVTPMWAHYGNNHGGFVIGFDVAVLQEVSRIS